MTEAAHNGVRLAADIGGTFTDVVLETPAGRHSCKVLTTARAPEEGVMAGVARLFEEAGLRGSDVDLFVHGTTLATNALIERKGARTAFLTTQGFRDVLEMGFEKRFEQYDINIERPPELVPRPLRFTGVPAKSRLNPASSSAASVARSGASSSARAASAPSRAARANLFHGQTARQSSQPKTRLPIALRNSGAICPLCSMVRYAMQRRASRR
jgi:hypothetical protein